MSSDIKRSFSNQIADKIKAILAKTPNGKEVKYQVNKIVGTPKAIIDMRLHCQFSLSRDSEDIDNDLLEGMIAGMAVINIVSEKIRKQIIDNDPKTSKSLPEPEKETTQ